MLTKPYVSIVICTYNRAGLLRKTLDSLPALDELGLAEVIVVDNNSTDDTREATEAFIARHAGSVNARYVFAHRQGLSVARNAGIRAAQADIVAFLDDDAIPCREWLATIAATFAGRPDVHALGGIIRPLFESERPEWLIKPFELPYTIVDIGDQAREYPAHLHPYGANMAIRKPFFENHSFPENLGRKGNSLLSGEETWVFAQMRKERKKVLYHPGMAVDHFIPSSRLTVEWIKKRYYYQGISNGHMQGEGAGSKLAALGTIAAKSVYLYADALFARSEGRKLLNACRRESIRGTLDRMRRRDPMPLTR